MSQFKYKVQIIRETPKGMETNSIKISIFNKACPLTEIYILAKLYFMDQSLRSVSTEKLGKLDYESYMGNYSKGYLDCNQTVISLVMLLDVDYPLFFSFGNLIQHQEVCDPRPRFLSKKVLGFELVRDLVSVPQNKAKGRSKNKEKEREKELDVRIKNSKREYENSLTTFCLTRLKVVSYLLKLPETTLFADGLEIPGGEMEEDVEARISELDLTDINFITIMFSESESVDAEVLRRDVNPTLPCTITKEEDVVLVISLADFLNCRMICLDLLSEARCREEANVGVKEFLENDSLSA